MGEGDEGMEEHVASADPLSGSASGPVASFEGRVDKRSVHTE